METTYRLADVDGALCVVAAIPMQDEPTIVHQFWPSIARTMDFVRYHFDYEQWSDKARWPELLASFSVKDSRPGEYWIEDTRYRSGNRGSYLELRDGGRTQPVKTQATPAPRPKTRLALDWSNGRWFKNTAAGWKLA